MYWAVGPFFFQLLKYIINMQEKLSSLLERTIKSIGYDILCLEILPSNKKNSIIRIYIDNDKGITISDCQIVSNSIVGILDISNQIIGNYILEVSSPGINRCLTKIEHFIRFTGSKVSIILRGLINGQHKLIGKIINVKNYDIDTNIFIIDNEGKEWLVPFKQVGKARLVSEI